MALSGSSEKCRGNGQKIHSGRPNWPPTVYFLPASAALLMLMEALTLRRILRHLGPHLRGQIPLLFGAGVTLLAEIIWRLAELWALKFVIDYAIGGLPLHTLPLGGWLSGLDRGTLITLAAAGMIGVTAMRAMSEYVNTVAFALAGNAVLNGVRARLYYHLQRMSLSFHAKARNGDLVVRMSTDINQLTDAVVTAALPLTGNLLVMIGMLGMMLWMNWKLAVIALLVLPLFWLLTRRFGRRIHEAARKQRKREGALAAAASEAFGAIKIVQALGLERVFADTFDRQNRKSLAEGARSTRLSSSLERSVDVLLATANAIVIWIAARMIASGELSLGDLLVFLSYLKSSLKPVQDLAKYTGRLAKAAAAGERVIGLLELQPDVRDLPGAKHAPPLCGDIRFDNVNFGYDDKHRVLKDISIEIRPGQRVAIIGPSGNGKTTLTNLLLRLYDPTNGRVFIDGRDIRSFTLASLRAQISVVMQDTILFAGTLRENIAVGMPNATRKQIETAARLAQAHEFIMAMPNGYDTVVGERGFTLSNGQRQRLSIARAAMRQAPIVILDEPTTGLDRISERAVLDALDRITAGRTTFMITHNLDQIKDTDLVLYLDGGRVRAFDTLARLSTPHSPIAHLFRDTQDAGHEQPKRLPAQRAVSMHS
jgi:ATP-binding cassette, subfamily B, bacterial